MVNCTTVNFLRIVSYTKRRKVFIELQVILDGVPHGLDYPIDDMHHTICGQLVSIENPDTVHCNNLRK